MKNSQAFHSSCCLRRALLLVYKGFCRWRDWQPVPVWLWISPCVIECWCKMASGEWSPPLFLEICCWNTASEKRGKQRAGTTEQETLQWVLASPGALFTRLKTFHIKAVETRDGEERNRTMCLCFERRNTAKHRLLCSAGNIVLCERVYGSASPLYCPGL